ncbi:MAG: ribonuclease P protein component [Planctomycetes bacterium]|nr:ribonuclease P protein component [Planctomycetota bacterium]
MESESQPSVQRPRLTLPRTARVTHGSDFERAWKLGSRARGELLVVVANRNGLEGARVGLSVGKKIWKRAVDRNRVRRIFREAFRLTRHDLPGGHDYILVPAAPKLEPTLAATCRELARLGPKAVARLREKQAGGNPAT